MTIDDGRKLQNKVSKPSCGVCGLTLSEKIDFFTYRALADSDLGIQDAKINNSRYWIDKAYQLGVDEGKLIQQKINEDKIKEIFDIK